MKILPIVANKIFKTNPAEYPKKSGSNIYVTNPIPFDTVSFTGSKASGTPLRKLAEYGMPDMYTGQDMLTYSTLSRILKNGVFDFPLKKLLPILNKYKGTLHETETEFLKILKSVEKKQPDIKINDALKLLFPEHQKKLLRVQQPVFEELIQKACDLPKDYYNDFMDLMRYTSKKIAKDPTISHFSEKEFIYRLQQVAKQIKIKKRHAEVSAINNLIREAKTLFSSQVEEKKKFGRGITAKKLKMEYQMQPSVLKQNTKNMQHLRNLFEKSVLRNNRDIQNIFDITNAKIYGFPIVEPFKRQEFIYDLKNIIKYLKDKKLESSMIATAHKLPTSTENVSAFIVKHVNDTPEKIGFYMLKGSLVSIEHIDAKVPQIKEEPLQKIKGKKKKKKAGNNSANKNHIKNYGLSSAYINSLRSNTSFDNWLRRMPVSYSACQKYVDRLIELYEEGIFAKVGLNKNYIFQFVERVQSRSPKEKPLIIDMHDFH